MKYINFIILILLSNNTLASAQLLKFEDIPTVEEIQAMTVYTINNQVVTSHEYIHNLNTKLLQLKHKMITDEFKKKHKKSYDKIMKETHDNKFGEEYIEITRSINNRFNKYAKDLLELIRKEEIEQPQLYDKLPIIVPGTCKSEKSSIFNKILVPILRFFYSSLGYKPIKLLK